MVVVVDVALDALLVDAVRQRDATLQLAVDGLVIAGLLVLAGDDEDVALEIDLKLFRPKRSNCR